MTSAALLFIACSVGVYLGPQLRFNSWDFIKRRDEIWAPVAAIASRPTLYALIAVFAAFLWRLYAAIDVWIAGLVGRYRAAARATDEQV